MNTRILTFADSLLIAILACLLLTGFIVQPVQALRAPADLELETMASQIRSRVQLSTEEKNWLASKPIINVGVGDYPPFHFVANGVPQGLSIDYVRTFCMVYSLDCNYVAGLTVPQSIRSMTEPNGITVQVGWQKNAERERVAIFTGPYVSSPFVIYNLDNNKQHIFSMDDLIDKRVVVEKGYAIHRKLQNQFPDLQLIEVATSTAALKYLASHQADAYVGSLMAGLYLIHKLGLSNIEVQAPAPFEPNLLEIAVRRDWPLLASLFSKAQSAVSNDEHRSLKSRWFNIHVEGLISKEKALLYGAMATATIVLLLFITAIVVNRRLRREIIARAAAEHQFKISDEHLCETMKVLSQSEEKYRELVDNSLIGIFTNDLTGQFIFVNNAMVRMFDFDSIEQMEKSTTLTIWAEIKDREQMLEMLKKHGRVDNFEAETITHTGRRIFVIFSARLDDEHISGMVMDITEHQLAQQKIQLYQQRLKSLGVELNLAEEQERRRIAAELHDNIGQSLVFSRMQLASLRSQAANEKSIELIDELSQTLLHIIQDTKELLFELSSPLLYEIGLSAAVSHWISEQIISKHGLETEFIDHSAKRPQNKEMKLILFRNIRELLINVVKHAHAKKVIVSFENCKDNLIISVQDDGIGFSFEHELKKLKSKTGFGLFSIYERMDGVGGSLKIESETNKGCKAILTVPLNV